MPLYESGQWEPITITDSNVTAIHAHLMPDGTVLYWHARYGGDGANFTSYIFNPLNNSMSQRIIIVWGPDPDGIEQQALFCSGSTFLSHGRLLVAGGERFRPPAGFRGIKYSYYWNGVQLLPLTKMNKGRWYPQLTRLSDGNVVAMSGYEFNNGGVIELIPEWFDPVTNTWNIYPNEASQPVPLYNGAYVIPFGPYAGQIFYDLIAWGGAMSQGLRFDPNAGIDVPYWSTYGGTGIARDHGNSCMLQLRSDDQNARIINACGGNGVSNTVSMIEIGNNLNPQ